LEYTDNNKTGTGYVHVVGMGNYEGTLSASFNILDGGTGTGTGKQENKPSAGTVYKSGDGSFEVLPGDNMTVSFKNTSKKKSVKIPETVVINGYTYTVTEIANNAFKNNKKIKTVTIPKTIIKIGKNAFSGAKKLKTITIKSTKVSIGKNAFKEINKKATFKVPKKSYKKMSKLLKKKKYGWKKTMKVKKG